MSRRGIRNQLIMGHPWHRDGPPTVADLELMVRPLRVAWVWERADNPGVSITNAAENIVVNLREVLGTGWAVVECYGPESYAHYPVDDDRPTFDLVTLGDDAEPIWTRLGRSQPEALAALVAMS